MVDPFVIDAVDVLQGPEWTGVVDRLRPLVDQCALLARERRLSGVRLDEVLAHLRADRLQPKAEMREDRVIAAQGAAPLQQVDGAEQGQRTEADDTPAPFRVTAQRQPGRDCS